MCEQSYPGFESLSLRQNQSSSYRPGPLTTQDTSIWYKGPSRVPWRHIATVCLVTSPLQCHNHHRFYPASYIYALLGFSYFTIVNASNYAVLQLCVTLSPKQQSGGSFPFTLIIAYIDFLYYSNLASTVFASHLSGDLVRQMHIDYDSGFVISGRNERNGLVVGTLSDTQTRQRLLQNQPFTNCAERCDTWKPVEHTTLYLY